MYSEIQKISFNFAEMEYIEYNIYGKIIKFGIEAGKQFILNK